MPNKVTEKEFRRRLAAAENMAVRQRNYRRARDRALAKLSTEFKERYLELLAQEKEKDEKEGKRWHNLTDNLPTGRATNTERPSNTDRGDTSTNPQDKGNRV